MHRFSQKCARHYIRTIKGLKFEVTESAVRSKLKHSESLKNIRKHYVPFWSFHIPEFVRCTISGIRENKRIDISLSFKTDSRFNFYASEKFNRFEMETLIEDNPQFFQSDKLIKSSDIEIDLYRIDQDTAWSVVSTDVQKKLAKEASQWAIHHHIKNPKIKDVKFEKIGTMQYCAVFEIEMKPPNPILSQEPKIIFVNGNSGWIKKQSKTLMTICVVAAGAFATSFIHPMTFPIYCLYYGQIGFAGYLVVRGMLQSWNSWRKSRPLNIDRVIAMERSEQERYAKKLAKKQRNNDKGESSKSDAKSQRSGSENKQSTHKTTSSSSQRTTQSTRSNSYQGRTFFENFGRHNQKREAEKGYDFLSLNDHELLGLDKHHAYPASEIRSSFLAQAKRYHPDLCRNPEDMAYYVARFKSVNQAYMRLKK
jgi:hypothetical protein